MKTKPAMDPSAAFPDTQHPPDEASLKAALGRAATPLAKVVANLSATAPGVTTACSSPSVPAGIRSTF